MKKVLFLVLLMFISLCGITQTYEVFHIEELVQADTTFCINNESAGIIIYGENNCDYQMWYVTDYNTIIIEEEYVDSIVINNLHHEFCVEVNYSGCNFDISERWACFTTTNTDENPFNVELVWKQKGASLSLNGGSPPFPFQFSYLWSTGETTEIIEVSEPGTYSVTLTDDCGSATYSVEVRDNVEIYRASTDLVTNKNQVTWRTTPEQSEYISAVKVYRNNELVGTVPYADGVFTDNIGSENTQWQYYIVGVSVEGDDCPIPSYWKRTIHLDRIQDSQGNLILQWTPYEEESPEKDVVSAYGIYDVVNGIPNHVIDVGNFTNVYTYNPADFHGYGAVAAVFAEKGLEEFAFSNLTKQMLDIDENITEIPVMKIYPNPSNGAFTVECVSDLIVYNVIGQVIATSHATENGIHNFSLGTGIYFVKSVEGAVQKIIVE